MRVDEIDNETDEVDDLTAGDIPDPEELGEDNETDDTDDTDDTTDTTDDATDAATDRFDRTTSASLTLADISTTTGIPYVTIARYARENAHRLSTLGEGKGKSRRYYPGAVAAFREIKEEAGARRGRGGLDTHRVGERNGAVAKPPRKAPRKPRTPRTRVRPTSAPATIVVASQAKRRGRPRKSADTSSGSPSAPMPARRGRRVVPRRNVVLTQPTATTPHAPLSDDSKPVGGAQSAFHRAHLTAQIETLQETIDHLTAKQSVLKAEISRLS